MANFGRYIVCNMDSGIIIITHSLHLTQRHLGFIPDGKLCWSVYNVEFGILRISIDFVIKNGKGSDVGFM